MRDKLHKKHDSTSNLEQSLGITRNNLAEETFNTTNSFLKISKIPRVAELDTTRPCNFYRKRDFQGLVSSNYAIPIVKKSKANEEVFNEKNNQFNMGFPYPDFAGIACISSNKPLSKTIDLSKTNGLTNRLNLSRIERQRLREEKIKLQEAQEAEKDVNVS